MQDTGKELEQLIDQYGADLKTALKEHPNLEYLYALADLRENLLEWYPFAEGAKILQVGSDYGALTGMYRRSAERVIVLDESEEQLRVNQKRYGDFGNVRYVQEDVVTYADSFENNGKKDFFDYVLFVGSLDRTCAVEQLEAAKRLLKPDGTMIVAVSNRYGVKYWAGAEPDPQGFALDEVQALVAECQPGVAKWYYPMPDYKLPTSIYSEDYMPQKGDLSKILPAYDNARLFALDSGRQYDMICEDGRFPQYANAYLLIMNMDQTPAPAVDFIKYNTTRSEEFQIKTEIGREQAVRYVEKSELCLAGSGHIESFPEKYESLKDQNPRIAYASPVISEDQAHARFPYIEGSTLLEKLGQQIREGQEPKAVIQNALELLYDVSPEYLTEFVETAEFVQVFGQVSDPEQLKGQAFTVSNIDALFENVLIQKDTDQIYGLDYEWVFSFPIPVHFVQYRALRFFYQSYHSLMEFHSLEEFLGQFGITAAMAAVYEEMERGFQAYVHGDVQATYLDPYMKRGLTEPQVAELEQTLEKNREKIEELDREVHERDTALRKVQEVQRLTNNHVHNLEVMIADLRRENGNMAATMDYLNRHQALAYKVWRRMKASVDKQYPEGTVGRKKLKYVKRTVRHPFKSFAMYTTKHGRNLIEGDFKIGEDYLQHGKLVFPKEENPKVSIIIPVYNQIHYTYACLVSILEYTKDVSYEVIIADDVSMDATLEIRKFTENLVICRNDSNQGFLKNCNRAAKQARGQYIMFLNNDTKVTENWLSSLVTLIESDDSIGMVGSKLVYPDGRLQEAGGILWSDGSGWNYGRLDDPDKAEYNYVKDVDYISGAAILLSNDLWKQIGGFDTRFAPAYCEDSDLAFEVRKAGYRVVYQPLSKVIHFEGISNGTDVEGTGLKRYQVENSKKLRQKWADEFAKQCENNGNPNPFRARERSMGKKVILVIDHYVPTYDRDAGSKTTYQYLKMFLKKGYVVKFLGDNFLHEEPYSTTLQQMGIEILYGADFQGKIWDWLKENGDEISFAYLNRPHIAKNYIDFIQENTNIKCIYYGHDLHFLRESREYEITGDEALKESAEYWKSIELGLMHKAAVSYYPSYIERDAIKAIDPEIPVKDITAYVYEDFLEHIPEDFAKREGLLFVGGFAHPPNADAVIWFAKEVFPMIWEQEHIPFYVVGSKVTDEVKALEQPDNGIIIKGFVSDEELAELYASSKIVVVPLRYGAGVKGKVVEAIYNGAPIITTSVGAEGIPEVESVLLVEDEPEAFAKACLDLYHDDAACLELSRKTQSYIREHFSVDAAWSVIEEDFR